MTKKIKNKKKKDKVNKNIKKNRRIQIRKQK